MLYERGTLKGTLSTNENLSGTISVDSQSLVGFLSIFDGEYSVYDGPYEIAPDFEGAVLDTADKRMTHDVTINPIQVESVSNTAGGRTVYIGGI